MKQLCVLFMKHTCIATVDATSNHLGLKPAACAESNKSTLMFIFAPDSL